MIMVVIVKVMLCIMLGGFMIRICTGKNKLLKRSETINVRC